jgi:hypothetical protein
LRVHDVVAISISMKARCVLSAGMSAFLLQFPLARKKEQA